MKKRKLFLSLISLMLFSSVLFTACGNKGNNTESEAAEKTASETSASSEATKKTSENQSETSVQSGTDKSEAQNSQDSNEPADMSFFDDAVFVGDSVTMGLKNYVNSQRNSGVDCLGEARFLTAGSMSYTNSLFEIGAENSIHPTYQGKEVRIEDGLKTMEAKKVFIMLGMNDFCIIPHDMAMDNVQKTVDNILEKNPDAEIYIQSVTPTLNDSGSFCNANIREFNDGLKELCTKNSLTYVDVASVTSDSNGVLIASYCSDPEDRGVHFTYDGCKAWVDYLCKEFC